MLLYITNLKNPAPYFYMNIVNIYFIHLITLIVTVLILYYIKINVIAYRRKPISVQMYATLCNMMCVSVHLYNKQNRKIFFYYYSIYKKCGILFLS